jgi:hypothetical protein
MKTHVTASAVIRDGKPVLVDPVVYHAGLRQMKLGEGEAVVIRLEREADAKRYHRLKWFYGFIVKQCVENTGYTVPELDAMFRALFMPADVPTLSLMSDEQMRDFNIQSEAYAAEVIGVVIVGPDEARRYAA